MVYSGEGRCLGPDVIDYLVYDDDLQSENSYTNQQDYCTRWCSDKIYEMKIYENNYNSNDRFCCSYTTNVDDFYDTETLDYLWDFNCQLHAANPQPEHLYSTSS